jgi:hypothetical protein
VDLCRIKRNTCTSEFIVTVSKRGLLQLFNILIQAFSNWGDVDTYLISEHFEAAYMILKTGLFKVALVPQALKLCSQLFFYTTRLSHKKQETFFIVWLSFYSCKY